MISPDPRFGKKKESKRVLFVSRKLGQLRPPGAFADAQNDRVGRDERDQANPSGARARAKQTGEGCRNFGFKGRPSRDDDLSAVRTSSTRRRTVREERERSDGRAPGNAGSAICVQRLDDSLNSAIHTRYRSLLRSSSMHEPRGPPLEVVNFRFATDSTQKRQTDRNRKKMKRDREARRGARGRRESSPASARLSSGRREPPTVYFLRSSERGEERKGLFLPRDLLNDSRGSRQNAPKTLMILPQVHLRKPCYDFYFL